MKIFNLLVLFITILFSCCKEEEQPCFDLTNPKCENYDPCHDKRATADFTISQYSGWLVKPGNEPEFCDTISAINLQGGAEFNALMPSALEYYWQIGIDTRKFTGQQLKLLFWDYTKDTANNLQSGNPLWYKPIPVTLLVRNKASSCIPATDTLINKTKNLVFSRKELHYGKFKGQCNSDNQERIIEFYFYFDSLEQNMFIRPKYIIKNLPQKDSLALPARIMNDAGKVSSYKQLWWDTERNIYNTNTAGMNKWKMFINTKPDGKDEVTIEYRYTGENDKTPQEVNFKGTRIN